jgi:hypothetical protein
VAVDDESVAVTSTGVIADPVTEAWAPGSVTVTALVTVQSKVPDPVNPAESVAVSVTA